MFSFFRKKSTEVAKTPEESKPPKEHNMFNTADDLKYTVYGSFSNITLLFCFDAGLFCVSDFIRTIKDPEKPNTLEELNVVYEDGIFVS